MHIANLIDKAKFLAEENSTTILTSLGCVGVVSTAFLTAKASFKAVQLIEDKERADQIASDGLRHELPKNEMVKLVWPQYIPALASGSLTIGSIIMAHRAHSNKAAALIAAYGLRDKALQEYREKVTEKFGLNKETGVRDEIAQDRVNTNPPNEKTVIITGGGDVLCYDTLSDRYFRSTVEKIKQAENAVNFEIANHDEVSLGRFYDELGLKPTPFSDTIGWNIDRRVEVEFSTTMSPDNQPCIAMDFKLYPEPSYHKYHE